MAKFIDAELKAGNKGQSDEELEATLDKALMLFRYIQARISAPRAGILPWTGSCRGGNESPPVCGPVQCCMRHIVRAAPRARADVS